MRKGISFRYTVIMFLINEKIVENVSQHEVNDPLSKHFNIPQDILLGRIIEAYVEKGSSFT